jgi:hypothetical protein
MHQSRLKMYIQMILWQAKTIGSDNTAPLMCVGNTYLYSAQLLVHGYKSFLLFFMNLDPRLRLLVKLVAGNLRNDMISHGVLKHANNMQHTCETHSFSYETVHTFPTVREIKGQSVTFCSNILLIHNTATGWMVMN